MRRCLLCIVLLLFCIPITANAEECNHEWGEWTVTEKTSCDYPGTETRWCYECYDSQERTIPTIPHVWGDWVVTEQPTCAYFGTKRRICARCKDFEETETPKSTIHNFGEWEVVESPTVFDVGIEERVCDCLKLKEKREIQKLKPVIKLNKTKLTLKKGKTYKLRIKKIANGDGYKSSKSSKKKCVSIQSTDYNTYVTIKAKKKGTSKITIKLDSGVKATCTVKVK